MTTPMQFEVRVAAGSLTSRVAPSYVVPHSWTPGGIAVEGGGTGAHLLLTAVASCVLNEVCREAEALGVVVDGVLVRATGDFDSGWSSSDMGYEIDLDTDAEASTVTGLIERVEAVAEIPRAISGQVRVKRR